MKKILIIKHGSLGDIVFALPAFASIRKPYSDAEIYVLTESKYINFFKRWNIFDFFFEDNRKESFLKRMTPQPVLVERMNVGEPLLLVGVVLG